MTRRSVRLERSATEGGVSSSVLWVALVLLLLGGPISCSSKQASVEPAPAPEPAPTVDSAPPEEPALEVEAHEDVGYPAANVESKLEVVPLGEVMPSFPWPPPEASGTYSIALDWLVDDPISARLRDLDGKLVAALDHVGYGQRSYWRVPGGYALTTRLERIQPNGATWTGEDRWVLQDRPAAIFSLVDYLRALFVARPGQFRVLVFVVTPQAFAAVGPEVTAETAVAWVGGGFTRLPESIGAIPLSSAPFACTALIYEFERAAESDPGRVVVPGRIEVRRHLELSGVWGEIEP